MRAGVGEGGACGDCDAGHDHCHGTLVVHLEGWTECLASPPPCDAVTERHALVVDCGDLRPPCGCAGEIAASGGG